MKSQIISFAYINVDKMKSSYRYIHLKTTALLFLVSFVTHANPAGPRVSSKVTDVQVSLDGALITQTATFVLKSGNNRVVVDGLAADADLSSLRLAFTQKGISMAGYQLIPRYPRQEDQTPLMRQLGDSIEQIKRRSEEELLESSVLQQEREMILANKSLGGEGNFSVAELEKLADFYRARLSSIDNRVLQISRRQQKSFERMQGLQRQLDSLSLEFPEQVQQLILELKAMESGSTGLKVTYLSKSAHWQPEYELISQGAASPIELKVRARVVQHTGIDWTDVRWTLSTARARGRTEKPVALPWILRFLQPITRKFICMLLHRLEAISPRCREKPFRSTRTSKPRCLPNERSKRSMCFFKAKNRCDCPAEPSDYSIWNNVSYLHNTGMLWCRDKIPKPI